MGNCLWQAGGFSKATLAAFLRAGAWQLTQSKSKKQKEIPKGVKTYRQVQSPLYHGFLAQRSGCPIAQKHGWVRVWYQKRGIERYAKAMLYAWM